MKKYKVCVYAISKNEEAFVERWVKSMKEADAIIVLDTGSSDNTVKLLKENGVTVYEEKIEPWRFDTARNKILSLIPDEYDICVATDLDEVFEEGWKDKILSVWDDSVTRIKYTYNWSFNEYGMPATTFLANKIHKRDYYKWEHPVHEVLAPLKEEQEVICKEIILNHYPDKNKSRASYLPLLELSVKENPFDDRNMHYLGREYMYYLKWDKCIETLQKHLSLKTASWKDERAASMRFIARSYTALNNRDEAIIWYLKAIEEAPYLREAYIELAYLYYEDKQYQNAYIYLKNALSILNKNDSYINEEFAWNSFVYDLMSICCFNLQKYDEALMYVREALKLDKNNLRLQLNLEEMEKHINKKSDN